MQCSDLILAFASIVLKYACVGPITPPAGFLNAGIITGDAWKAESPSMYSLRRKKAC
ncbi:hypothetical protein PF005_g16671 [Phytophthora fragariae]|uniref:Uncharacterized protein n=2 Tax=Phytophthora TaxID=4783 RepID=A0A6A3T8S5_9STRA|nr:hypothetical protein PF003_g35700 [Phytophthora fragariae]KAE9027706.1 hypothetical protein PR002_g10591 [Phytophthora rubi]KAE8944132.1 hypothetical protein PF009_g6180 [Phytophthora fragariae]KAE9017647.1 hypothetical protein PF011_g6608 [Phytophthora fragariae]KAE9096992.1 hypothetical protein PF010_g16128 [Phytophthora fragariae]